MTIPSLNSIIFHLLPWCMTSLGTSFSPNVVLREVKSSHCTQNINPVVRQTRHSLVPSPSYRICIQCLNRKTDMQQSYSIPSLQNRFWSKDRISLQRPTWKPQDALSTSLSTLPLIFSQGFRNTWRTQHSLWLLWITRKDGERFLVTKRKTTMMVD